MTIPQDSKEGASVFDISFVNMTTRTKAQLIFPDTTKVWKLHIMNNSTVQLLLAAFECQRLH